ncbi:hypothetical protein, partial [Roseinatronobacter bogoriensis]|uniref:hypothetical protein n=1 Tax=Roseinatronobacter bogoriensis TaxID=119542 RepID=UPI001B3C14C5
TLKLKAEKQLSLTSNPSTYQRVQIIHPNTLPLFCASVPKKQKPQNSEADTHIIGQHKPP